MSAKCHLLKSNQGLKLMRVRYGNARRLDLRPVWLFDMQPTSVLHRAVLHIRYWADMSMSAKFRLLISDRGKKPMSSRCENARRLDIGPIWLFDMQPTSSRVAHLISDRCESRCWPDVERYIGPTSDRYKMFAGYLHFIY